MASSRLLPEEMDGKASLPAGTFSLACSSPSTSSPCFAARRPRRKWGLGKAATAAAASSAN